MHFSGSMSRPASHLCLFLYWSSFRISFCFCISFCFILYLYFAGWQQRRGPMHLSGSVSHQNVLSVFVFLKFMFVFLFQTFLYLYFGGWQRGRGLVHLSGSVSHPAIYPLHGQERIEYIKISFTEITKIRKKPPAPNPEQRLFCAEWS